MEANLHIEAMLRAYEGKPAGVKERMRELFRHGHPVIAHFTPDVPAHLMNSFGFYQIASLGGIHAVATSFAHWRSAYESPDRGMSAGSILEDEFLILMADGGGDVDENVAIIAANAQAAGITVHGRTSRCGDDVKRLQAYSKACANSEVPLFAWYQVSEEQTADGVMRDIGNLKDYADAVILLLNNGVHGWKTLIQQLAAATRDGSMGAFFVGDSGRMSPENFLELTTNAASAGVYGISCGISVWGQSEPSQAGVFYEACAVRFRKSVRA